jgi:hypothetical protein
LARNGRAGTAAALPTPKKRTGNRNWRGRMDPTLLQSRHNRPLLLHPVHINIKIKCKYMFHL